MSEEPTRKIGKDDVPAQIADQLEQRYRRWIEDLQEAVQEVVQHRPIDPAVVAMFERRQPGGVSGMAFYNKCGQTFPLIYEPPELGNRLVALVLLEMNEDRDEDRPSSCSEWTLDDWEEGSGLFSTRTGVRIQHPIMPRDLFGFIRDEAIAYHG